ncbi:MAG: DUF6444 domain-containing protein, partial [Acidimicrobiia bacterium]
MTIFVQAPDEGERDSEIDQARKALIEQRIEGLRADLLAATFNPSARLITGNYWKRALAEPGQTKKDKGAKPLKSEELIDAATRQVLFGSSAALSDATEASQPPDLLQQCVAGVTAGPVVVPPLTAVTVQHWAATTEPQNRFLPIHSFLFLYGLLPETEGTRLVGIAFRLELDAIAVSDVTEDDNGNRTAEWISGKQFRCPGRFCWTNLAESFNVWWMSARAARRAGNQQATASRHSHAQPSSREELQRQVERQQREIEKLREQVAERDRQLADAERQVADAEKQIADLERQLAARQKNSLNSSKPPSSDGLAGNSRLRGRRKKSKRKPGGQKGHPGRHRPLAPPAQVQEVRPVLPTACKHCDQPLPQQSEQIQTVGPVQRHQVTELPPIQPYSIEYQCPKVVCPACGEATRAPLPTEAQGDFGPQL